MSSFRDQIVSAVVATLAAGGGPASLTVHRYRTKPLGTDVLPAMLVYLVEESVKEGPGQGTGPKLRRTATRTVTARVEIRINAGTVAPDDAIDPYLNWMVQQIMADPTFGGLSHDCKEMKTEWAAVEDDKVYAATQTDFEISYFTSAADPTAVPS